ncbi:MAG: hypothetical protein AB7O48_04560 [Cyclobacteriaceae bacterium]
MAGGLHVFDMIKKLRENKSLKEKNYFKNKDTLAKSSSSIDGNYRIATKEERESIIKGVLISHEQEKRRFIKILVVSILVTAILIAASIALIKIL